MGEVSLLAQEKQNQVRFCYIDYICRKRRLSWSKSILHMMFTRGFSKNKHTYIFFSSQPLTWRDLNYVIFRGTVRDRGLKDQGHSLLWICTPLSFAPTLQTPVTNVWSEVKRKCNTSFGWSRIPLPSPQVIRYQVAASTRQLRWDRWPTYNFAKKQTAWKSFSSFPFSFMSKLVLSYLLHTYNGRVNFLNKHVIQQTIKWAYTLLEYVALL